MTLVNVSIDLFPENTILQYYMYYMYYIYDILFFNATDGSGALLSQIFYDMDGMPPSWRGQLASELPGISPHIESVNGAEGPWRANASC